VGRSDALLLRRRINPITTRADPLTKPKMPTIWVIPWMVGLVMKIKPFRATTKMPRVSSALYSMAPVKQPYAVGNAVQQRSASLPVVEWQMLRVDPEVGSTMVQDVRAAQIEKFWSSTYIFAMIFGVLFMLPEPSLWPLGMAGQLPS
jgi:hypothetical protein